MPTVFFPEADLPASSRRVFEALGDLAAEVQIDRWCLIGGLMVEVVLRSRGRTPLRPTDDGDVVGDVRADRGILVTISEALRRASFELVETGMEGEFGVRHRRGDGTTIDLLAPDNRTRNVEPPRPGFELLAAPGAEQALLTADPIRIVLAGERDVVLRVPSLTGALFAKTTAWKELAASPDRGKHLNDAAQLLAAATLDDLAATDGGPIPPKALGPRWRWRQEALSDHRAAGWGEVSMKNAPPPSSGWRSSCPWIERSRRHGALRQSRRCRRSPSSVAALSTVPGRAERSWKRAGSENATPNGAGLVTARKAVVFTSMASAGIYSSRTTSRSRSQSPSALPRASDS
jgi:hypothetical protein